MVIEWKSILFIITLVVVMLLIIKFVDSKKKLKGEVKRKLFHTSMGLAMLSFPYIFTSALSVFILGVIALVLMYFLKNTGLKKSLGTVLYDIDRESLGEVFFVISVFTIFLLSKGDKILYSIPILILTLADSTAALIGKNYGKNSLSELSEDAKSLEGSFMFFMVAFMCTLVPILLYTQVGREETLIISTIVGLNVAMVEMISHSGNDNLLIPLTTFAFLSTHIAQNADTLKYHLIALGIIFVLVSIANGVKALSKLAVVEAMVIGYLTVILYGTYAAIPPLFTIMTVMRFPKRQENEKSNVYDARIIETNIIIPTAVCGIAAITGWKKEFFMIYASAYAMHLIINSFVRFKYYIKMSEMDSILLSISKGVIFVYIPSLIVQKLVFGSLVHWSMLIFMFVALIASGIIIYFKKKDVKHEEILTSNGYMHMKIVLYLTIIISGAQVLAQNFLM